MVDVTLNRLSGREFGGHVLAVGFESGEAGMMASQVGVGSWLGGPVLFPPKMASKGFLASDQVKMINRWCRRKREAFAKDRIFQGVSGEMVS